MSNKMITRGGGTPSLTAKGGQPSKLSFRDSLQRGSEAVRLIVGWCYG